MDEKPENQRSAMGSLSRIIVGVLIAVPAVAIATAALTLIPPVGAMSVGIAGIVFFQSGEAFQSKLLAGVGGLLAMSGVLAWAIQQ